MPRLKKGEIASGVKSKSDAIRNNVERRVHIFRGLSSMVDPPWEDISFFQTAEKLANWECPLQGIVPISVKTLRKHVDAVYPGGLVALCLAARNMIGQGSDSPVRAKEDCKKKAALAIDSALEMTARYLDLLERMKRLSLLSGNVEMELSKHLRRYGQSPHIRRVE